MVVRGSACEAASCTSRSGTPASSAAVMNACRSVCRLTCLAIPARRVTRRTIRAAPCRSSRRPSAAVLAPLQARVLDVRAGGLRHPQAVEREQRDERVLGGRAEPGGNQEGAELVAVQGRRVRLVVQTGTADVRGRRVVEELFL